MNEQTKKHHDLERYEALPDTVKALPIFLLWRLETRAKADGTSGKATKVPRQPNRRHAKSNDPSTWCTFEDALRALAQDHEGYFSGLGIALQDGMVGVDCDNCRDPNTGEIAAWAKPHIEALQTYAEVSPSLGGIKLLAFGRLPGKSFQQPITVADADGKHEKIGQIEMYEPATSPRYFTLTGYALDDHPGDVKESQSALDACYAAFARTTPEPKARRPKASSGSDAPAAASVTFEDEGKPIDFAGSDDPSLVDRAWRYVSKMKDAVSGNNGHNATFAAACACYRFGLSDAAARKVMGRFNEAKTGGEPWSAYDLERKLRDAKVRVQRAEEFGTLGRPRIVVGPDEHRVIGKTVEALSADLGLFKRGGQLVRIVREQDVDAAIRRLPGTPIIKVAPSANVRERITRYAELVAPRRDPETKATVLVQTNPTQWLVDGVVNRGEWPCIRPLTGISDVPFLRPDGSICCVPGYDSATGVFYAPHQKYDGFTAAKLSRDEVACALDFLLDPLQDFLFEKPIHRSAAAAAIFTPAGRFAFSGPAPLFVCDANMRGAGKGLLVDAFAIINTGREASPTSYTNDSEELRKVITAIALAGDRIVNFDNVVGRLGNDVLDRLLTGTKWKDRLLGSNTTIDLPMTTTFFATGNNVRVGADTARRIIHIRQESPVESPETRDGFAYPNLREHLRREHPLLLRATLDILSSYIRSGRPKMGLKPYGSFEGWSDLIRSTVVWAGLEDPCLTRDQLVEQADETQDDLASLMDAWDLYERDIRYGDRGGMNLTDLLAALYAPSKPIDAASSALRGAIEAVTGVRAGQTPSARQVGNHLKHYRRRPCGGRMFDVATDARHRHGAVWRLLPVAGEAKP